MRDYRTCSQDHSLGEARLVADEKLMVDAVPDNVIDGALPGTKVLLLQPLIGDGFGAVERDPVAQLREFDRLPFLPVGVVEDKCFYKIGARLRQGKREGAFLDVHLLFHNAPGSFVEIIGVSGILVRLRRGHFHHKDVVFQSADN